MHTFGYIFSAASLLVEYGLLLLFVIFVLRLRARDNFEPSRKALVKVYQSTKVAMICASTFPSFEILYLISIPEIPVFDIGMVVVASIPLIAQRYVISAKRVSFD
jgi:hypothetical protein